MDLGNNSSVDAFASVSLMYGIFFFARQMFSVHKHLIGFVR